MQAVKVTGTVNQQGQLILDQPLTLPENRRVEVIILVEDVANPGAAESFGEDTPTEEILTDLRQAWREAVTGQTIPVSQLWDNLDDE